MVPQGVVLRFSGGTLNFAIRRKWAGVAKTREVKSKGEEGCGTLQLMYLARRTNRRNAIYAVAKENTTWGLWKEKCNLRLIRSCVKELGPGHSEELRKTRMTS